MKKRDSLDLLRTLADFQKNVLENKPSMEAMVDEVRMMRFKIRPLQGDISLLNLKDAKLIEILWNLGKLDEFFRSQHDQLSRGQREVFFQFFDGLYEKFQTQLNRINLKSTSENISPTVEMEIFKEEVRKRKLN